MGSPVNASFVLLLGAIAGSGVAVAQVPAAAGKASGSLAERLQQLAAAAGDRAMSQDEEAVRLLGECPAAWVESDAADRKRIVKAVDAALNDGALRSADRTELYRAAIDALGRMEVDGARVLRRTYDRKRFPQKPEWSSMRALLVANIGRTKDRAMIDFLCERAARATEDEELAAAGEALGHHDDLPLAVRRDIVKTMITKYGGIEASASGNVLRADQPQTLDATNAKRTLEAIAGKWNATLAALTHQAFADANAWQRWYNKNKSANWDKDRRPG